MSWIRTAVNKAVEVGGNNTIARTVITYADSVVQQAGLAVAEGAKIFQDRIAARNFKSFKHAVKRLEEVSVSCVGIERVQLLRRWLVALKEVERISGGFLPISGENVEDLLVSDESRDSPRRPTLVLYYDPDLGGEPMDFHDVFLHSQALEGMTLSLILEPPNEEEVSLFLEIFGICLTGGRDVHNTIMGRIQDLAKAFSMHHDEILVKREEMLQCAQGAIAGLKVNAEIQRIDSEVSNIHKMLARMRTLQPSSGHEKLYEETTLSTVEALKEAHEQIQLCSKLDEILAKKKLLNKGDSPDIHVQKVDKLKILSESLANSALKAEKRISDHRYQKEEALKFRVAKTTEVFQIEKELYQEIGVLEKQREELEAELNKVNSLLAGARARLHNAREEKEQFDKASNLILEHFKSKEDELSRSIASFRAEVDVCSALIHFLEDSWVFQSSYKEQKEKQVNDEQAQNEEYFRSLATYILSAYKDAMGPSIIGIRKIVESLNTCEGLEIVDGANGENVLAFNTRKILEEEFLEYEAKILTTFSVVESIKKQLYTENKQISREVDQVVKENLDALEKMKAEFESFERPVLEIESLARLREPPLKQRPERSPSPIPRKGQSDKYEPMNGSLLELELETTWLTADTPSQNAPQSGRSSHAKHEGEGDEPAESHMGTGEKTLNPEAEVCRS